jgi:NTP pyrophosphatase (non-canonical NTP hydrolase)
MKKRTLQTLQDDRRAWADATYPRGSTQSISDQSLKGILEHLKKEVDELVDAMSLPNPPEQPHMELADIQLLVLAAATKMQLSATAHIENCYTKLEIVKHREWAPPNADGFIEHIRSADCQSVSQDAILLAERNGLKATIVFDGTLGRTVREVK